MLIFVAALIFTAVCGPDIRKFIEAQQETAKRAIDSIIKTEPRETAQPCKRFRQCTPCARRAITEETLVVFRLRPADVKLYQYFEQEQAKHTSKEENRLSAIVHVSKQYAEPDVKKSTISSIDEEKAWLNDMIWNRFYLEGLNNRKVLGIAGGMGPEAGSLMLIQVVGKLLEDPESLGETDIVLYSDTRGQPQLTNICRWKKGTKRRLQFLADQKFAATIAASNTFHVFLYGSQLPQARQHTCCITESKKTAWCLFRVLTDGDDVRKVLANPNFISLTQKVKDAASFYKAEAIGNLATAKTYQFGFYDSVSTKPDEKGRKLADKAIKEMKAGRPNEAKNLFLQIINKSFQKQPIILLGCTEVPVAIREEDIPSKQVLSSTYIGADALVEHAKKSRGSVAPQSYGATDRSEHVINPAEWS